MAKGYWIGRVDVQDAEAYKAYVEANAAAFSKFGARFVVRGGPFETAFGDARKHNVVLEFPSYEAAKTCFQSEAYQTISKDLKRGAEVDLIIIEGYDGD